MDIRRMENGGSLSSTWLKCAKMVDGVMHVSNLNSPDTVY